MADNRVEYIIIQGGGLGTRLRPLTNNRPKALVPVNNRPMIFHLFEKYSDRKFIVIGDYKNEVMESYLQKFAKCNYIPITATEKGNIAGLKKALQYIPDGKSFMIIWSDLILGDEFDFDINFVSDCYIGTTDQFECSWSYYDGVLEKKVVPGYGVAGLFLVSEKKVIGDIPESGSFTKYLTSKDISMQSIDIRDSYEVGTIESYNRHNTLENRCRPYNRITFDSDKVIKEGITEEGRKILEKEKRWYKEIQNFDYKGIPQIYSLEPLTMSAIDGDNIFKADIPEDKKKLVIENMVSKLCELHDLVSGKYNAFDIQKEYYSKTLDRLYGISSCIPFANDETIMINGKECINVLRSTDVYQNMTNKLQYETQFGIIHGDCTFTNTLIDPDYNIYMIDPRGYFGNTDNIGDVYYDWAKVYYSISGAFDQFNVKNFTLNISENDVKYEINKSGWEEYTDYFLSLIPNCDIFRVKFIHSIVWLSLASHCWEDYDSMCLAFYNGIWLINELID